MKTVIGTFNLMIPQQIIHDRYRDAVIICNGETCVKLKSKVRTESKPFFKS